jgi:hypothetical protein
MAASHRNAASALLRRTGLLAGILAVLAGILGMHVLTGTHSMHSPAALTAALTADASAATAHTGAAAGHGHAAHGAAATSPTHVASGKQVTASSSVEPCPCSCSDSCASTHTMTASCTPSGKTGSISVPLPGTAVFDVISNARAPGAVPVSYSYLPGGPSPGELSISRT